MDVIVYYYELMICGSECCYNKAALLYLSAGCFCHAAYLLALVSTVTVVGNTLRFLETFCKLIFAFCYFSCIFGH